MNFYMYLCDAELGKEPLGSTGKYIWRGLKTVAGAIRRANKYDTQNGVRIYSFTNFYKAETFKLVYERGKKT